MPGLEELTLIRHNAALLSCGTSRGPGIPWQMYTHNLFTIVNYPELLDKQRPLPHCPLLLGLLSPSARFWRSVAGGSRLRPALRCGRERNEAPAMTLGVESIAVRSIRSLVACEFCHVRCCPVHSRGRCGRPAGGGPGHPGRGRAGPVGGRGLAG